MTAIKSRLAQLNKHDLMHLGAFTLFLIAGVAHYTSATVIPGFEFFFMVMAISTINQIINGRDSLFAFPYHPDPFGHVQVNNQYLILGTQRIALSNVKKVALDSKVKLGKKYYAYFSLPFNPIEGKTISIYFDQSSYVAFKQYISTSIDDVEFIR